MGASGHGYGRSITLSTEEASRDRFAEKGVLYVRRVARHLRFPTADDDTNIALGMHEAHTHPLLQENWPFGRLGIYLDRILHQKKHEQSFQFLLSEMPLRNNRQRRRNSQVHLKVRIPSFAHRNTASERHCMVRHRLPVLHELLRRHVPRRDVFIWSLVDLWVQMHGPGRTHDLLSPVERVPTQLGRLHHGSDRHHGSGKAKGLLDR